MIAASRSACASTIAAGRLQVVEGRDQHVLLDGPRDARRRRLRRRVGRRADREQAHLRVVARAVEAALELEHGVAAGRRAGQAQGVEGRLGAGGRELDELGARHALHDPLGELHDRLVEGVERRADGGLALRGLDHARMAVADHERARAEHVVDVLAAVDVPHAGALAAGQDAPLPAGQGELGDGTAGDGGVGAGQKLIGAGRRRHGRTLPDSRDASPALPRVRRARGAARRGRPRPAAGSRRGRPARPRVGPQPPRRRHPRRRLALPGARAPHPGLRGRRPRARRRRGRHGVGARRSRAVLLRRLLRALPLLPHRSRAALQRPALRLRRDPGRDVRAVPLPRRPAAAAARRARRRPRRRRDGRVRHLVPHALHAGGPARGRARVDHVGRRRHRVRRRAAREVGRRDGHRHLLQPGEAGAGARARPRPRHRLHDHRRRRGGPAPHRRRGRRAGVRARRRRALRRGARLDRQGRARRDLRRARRRGRRLRHHPLLPRPEDRDRVVLLHPRGGRGLPRPGGAGPGAAAGARDVRAGGRTRRLRAHGGAARTSARSS